MYANMMYITIYSLQNFLDFSLATFAVDGNLQDPCLKNSNIYIYIYILYSIYIVERAKNRNPEEKEEEKQIKKKETIADLVLEWFLRFFS